MTAWWWRTGRIAAAVQTGVVGVALVCLVVIVVSAVLDPRLDPHGYTVIFGTIFAVGLLVLLLLAILSLVLVRRYRRSGLVLLTVLAAVLALSAVQIGPGGGLSVPVIVTMVIEIAVTVVAAAAWWRVRSA